MIIADYGKGNGDSEALTDWNQSSARNEKPDICEIMQALDSLEQWLICGQVLPCDVGNQGQLRS